MRTDFQGECLCGEVRYRISGTPGPLYLCHCSRCRKLTGSAHAANLFLSDAELVFERGGDHVRTYLLPGTRKTSAFCLTCGAAMPRERVPGSVLLPVGSLDDTTDLTPTAHIWVDSRADWEDALPDTPRFGDNPR